MSNVGAERPWSVRSRGCAYAVTYGGAEASWSLPRRGNRTKPGVLTPGFGIVKRRALKVAKDWGGMIELVS